MSKAYLNALNICQNNQTSSKNERKRKLGRYAKYGGKKTQIKYENRLMGTMEDKNTSTETEGGKDKETAREQNTQEISNSK